MGLRRRSRRVLLALALLVLLFGLSELGVRTFTPWEGEQSRARIAGLRESLSGPWIGPGGTPDAPEGAGSRVLQPFTGWMPTEVQARLADDLERYRTESPPTYDVCLLGGSGAVALAAAGGARLVSVLEGDPRLAGREIRLHAYGIEGFKQPQQERLLACLISFGHAPDAVIELDGFDEAEIGWGNARAGTSPLYPSAQIWRELTEGLRFDWELVDLLYELDRARAGALECCGRHLGMQLWRSALLDHASRLLLDLRLRKIEATEAAIRAHTAARDLEAELAGPRTSTEPADVERTIVRAFEEASIDMHALCERRGIAYLHVLEPAGPGAGAGVERVHPALREAGRRLAERGIAFLDGAAVLGDLPEVLFDGSGRLGDRGLEALAESAARALPIR
ncbi:MAG: hypothetical protein ACKVXR_01470 [Planctomycetota bacterium]